VDLKCNNTRVGSASGLQLALGRITPSPEWKEEASEQLEQPDKDDGPAARPAFILGLVVPLGLLAVCGVMLAGKLGPIPSGVILAVLALAGLIVMIFAANVDYRDEIAREESRQAERPSWISPEAMAAMFSTETRGAVWVSLVFYILIGLFAIAGAVLPVVIRGAPLTGKSAPDSRPNPG